MSREQAFTKFVTTDPTGKLLFKASLPVARSVAQSAQGFGAAAKAFGEAGRQLNELAAAMARSKSLSMQESYSRLIADPSRAELIRRVREEEKRATEAATRQRWPLWPGEKESKTRSWI
jgi:hypothetical protein